MLRVNRKLLRLNLTPPSPLHLNLVWKMSPQQLVEGSLQADQPPLCQTVWDSGRDRHSPHLLRSMLQHPLLRRRPLLKRLHQMAVLYHVQHLGPGPRLMSTWPHLSRPHQERD